MHVEIRDGARPTIRHGQLSSGRERHGQGNAASVQHHGGRRVGRTVGVEPEDDSGDQAALEPATLGRRPGLDGGLEPACVEPSAPPQRQGGFQSTGRSRKISTTSSRSRRWISQPASGVRRSAIGLARSAKGTRGALPPGCRRRRSKTGSWTRRSNFNQGPRPRKCLEAEASSTICHARTPP